MPVVLVAIVILAGYIFTNRYPLARFRQLRSKGWSDYGHLISYGALFSGLGGILVIFLDALNIPSFALKNTFNINIHQLLLSIHADYDQVQFVCWATVTLFLAFIVGYCTDNANNSLKATQKLANENEFEKILYTSSKEQRPIQVSLKSGKVYVGIVNQMSVTGDFNKTEYFTIFPLYSGYRDKDKSLLTLTNSYATFYEKLMPGHAQQDWQSLQNNFKTLMIGSEINSMAYFDFEAYKVINSSHRTSNRGRSRKTSPR
ncbi:MAG: hypothetical protein GX070_05645 [Alcaligenaceae bacterium]|nr:hypothetical protein [Alcaligenaceae bacterium]